MEEFLSAKSAYSLVRESHARDLLLKGLGIVANCALRLQVRTTHVAASRKRTSSMWILSENDENDLLERFLSPLALIQL